MRAQLGFASRALLITMGLLTLMIAIISIPNQKVVAQPACNWDCRTNTCCGREVMCNGGVYGSSGRGGLGVCATFCAGLSVPDGQACPY
ncbi:MAG: hypothetical protein ACJ763_02540 [Bdellovibrionia bacterium]